MKKLLAFLIVGMIASTASAEAELKQVCHDRLDKAGKPVSDKKTGKTAQDCKTIKVHEKVEGTPVPDKTPKKK
jgi:hypothetical protein